MGAPRHLWSEDWRRESEAAAQERAERRAQAEGPAGETPPDLAPGGRLAPGRRLAHRGRLRVALLVALVTLLSAGAAYAAVSLLTGSGGQSSAQAGTAPAWLGIEMASTGFGGAGFPTVGGFPGGFPTGSGVLITEVVPGSPAAAAGLGPGDVLTQIGSQLVATPADVQSAIAGLQAGDRVEIHYEQGATLYTTQATLAARPAGYP